MNKIIILATLLVSSSAFSMSCFTYESSRTSLIKVSVEDFGAVVGSGALDRCPLFTFYYK